MWRNIKKKPNPANEPAKQPNVATNKQKKKQTKNNLLPRTKEKKHSGRCEKLKLSAVVLASWNMLWFVTLPHQRNPNQDIYLEVLVQSSCLHYDPCGKDFSAFENGTEWFKMCMLFPEPFLCSQSCRPRRGRWYDASSYHSSHSLLSLVCTFEKEKHMGLLSYFNHPNQVTPLINITNHITLHILEQIGERCVADWYSNGT